MAWISASISTLTWDFLENILKQVRVPESLVSTLRGFWSGIRKTYQRGKAYSDWETATRGLLQGCPVSPVISLLTLLPLLRKIQQPGMDIISFADDLTLIGSLEIFLGMVLNPNKTIWALLWADAESTQSLKEFLGAQKLGNELVGSFRMLGLHTRNTPDQPATWDTLQGKRETLLRTCLQRLRACPIEDVRVALTEAFITAVTYGTAVEQHSASVTQWTARLAINCALQTNHVRFAEEVVGTLCFKGHRLIPT